MSKQVAMMLAYLTQGRKGNFEKILFEGGGGEGAETTLTTCM